MHIHYPYTHLYQTPFFQQIGRPSSGTGHGWSSRSSCDVAAMCLVGGNLHLFALHFVQHESYLRRFPSDLRSSGSERQMQICLHTLSILTILCCQLLLYTWTNSCYRWHTGLRTAASTRSSRLLGTSAGQCSNAASMHRRRLLASPRLSPCQVKKRNHKKNDRLNGMSSHKKLWKLSSISFQQSSKSLPFCERQSLQSLHSTWPSRKGSIKQGGSGNYAANPEIPHRVYDDKRP